MTCLDCEHYKVCKYTDYVTAFADTNDFMKNLENVELVCKYYESDIK